MASTGARRTGTGFVGLNQYLGLNQGIARDMGNRVAGKVEKVGGEAQGAIDNATQNFIAEADRETLTTPDDPDGLTLDDAQKRAGMGYGGPTSLGQVADVGSLYKGAADAQVQAQALGDNTGRATLLGKEYGGASSWGGGQLDSALAGAGGAGDRIGAAQQGYGRLLGYLGTAQQNAANYAAGAKQRTGDAAKWYGEQVGRLTPQAPTPTQRKPPPQRGGVPDGEPYDPRKWRY